MLRNKSQDKPRDFGTLVISNGPHSKARSEVYMAKTEWEARRRTKAETKSKRNRTTVTKGTKPE